ncbi:hypothetical protein [Microbacterium yannicii]|uniref:hypothetical protein n=1 Tax=Microbacterium yannicii TaxID=671622 RepID=UPI0002D8F561|nr:hypothetical protein [Microbacterium yannicii]
MSPAVVALLILAGLSESAGRILPLLSRRASSSRAEIPKPILFSLLLTGAAIDATVFALWPICASLLAPLFGAPATGPAPVNWTVDLIAPLVVAAIISFPLIGPFLHGLLIFGVGLGLLDQLIDATGMPWPAAAGCIAIAGIGLAAFVGLLRVLVGRVVVVGPKPRAAA